MPAILFSHLVSAGSIFFNAHKKLLTTAAVALAISAASFGAGWMVHSNMAAKAAEQGQKVAVRQVIKEVQVRDEVERRVYVEDLARVRALEAEKSRLTTQVAALQKEVDQYVPEIPGSAYLSRGAVSLLDQAALGSAATGSPTAIAAVEDTAPSDVSWRAFVSHEIDLRGRYNQARAQCNELIDWVETNVVNKPQS